MSIVNDEMTFFFLFTTSSQLDHDARCIMCSWTRAEVIAFTDREISGSLPRFKNNGCWPCGGQFFSHSKYSLRPVNEAPCIWIKQSATNPYSTETPKHYILSTIRPWYILFPFAYDSFITKSENFKIDSLVWAHLPIVSWAERLLTT